MVQVLGNLSLWREGYNYLAYPMPWLLMTWRRKERRHQNPGIDLVIQEYSGYNITRVKYGQRFVVLWLVKIALSVRESMWHSLWLLHWHSHNSIVTPVPVYSISQEICTRFCCALLCCGYAIVHNEFTWSIYPYSSGLLCWHWGNR